MISAHLSQLSPPFPDNPHHIVDICCPLVGLDPFFMDKHIPIISPWYPDYCSLPISPFDKDLTKPGDFRLQFPMISPLWTADFSVGNPSGGYILCSCKHPKRCGEPTICRSSSWENQGFSWLVHMAFRMFHERVKHHKCCLWNVLNHPFPDKLWNSGPTSPRLETGPGMPRVTTDEEILKEIQRSVETPLKNW